MAYDDTLERGQVLTAEKINEIIAAIFPNTGGEITGPVSLGTNKIGYDSTHGMVFDADGNITTDGDITLQKSGNAVLSVQSSDDNSIIKIESDTNNTGPGKDAMLQFWNNGVCGYTIGIADNDADRFSICTGEGMINPFYKMKTDGVSTFLNAVEFGTNKIGYDSTHGLTFDSSGNIDIDGNYIRLGADGFQWRNNSSVHEWLIGDVVEMSLNSSQLLIDNAKTTFFRHSSGSQFGIQITPSTNIQTISGRTSDGTERVKIDFGIVDREIILSTWNGSTDSIDRIVIGGNSAIADIDITNANLHIGDATNYLEISEGGIISLHGTAKRYEIVRPVLNQSIVSAHGKPTVVTVGVSHGFSLPIFNSDDEELYFTQCLSDSWDEESDIIVSVYVALAGAEDVGNKFNLQFSWEHMKVGEPLLTTSNDVEVETTVLTGRNDQYDIYKIDFTIDYDIDGAGNEIQPGEILFGRLRRIAASSSEVTNEIIVLNWCMKYQVNKVYASS